MRRPRHTDRSTAPPSIKHAERQAWRLGMLVTALVLLLSSVVVLGVKEIADERRLGNEQRRAIACVAKWANDYSARANRIGDLNDQEENALRELVSSIPGRNEQKFNRALRQYLDAINLTANARKSDPIPPSPKFLCDLQLSGKPLSAVTVTATPHPIATTTATTTARASALPRGTTTMIVPRTATSIRTATATQTAHSTRTVIRVATRTRTVTATVTVSPPCRIPILC